MISISSSLLGTTVANFEQHNIWVLKASVVLESDLEVEAFSKEAGLIQFRVFGAGNLGSTRGAQLKPFSQLVVTLSRQQGFFSFGKVHEQICVLAFAGRNLACAMYLSEITSRCWLKDFQDDALWQSFGTTLYALTRGELNASLRNYESSLLEALGVLPDFLCDAEGSPVKAHSQYLYRPETGFVPVHTQGSDVWSGRLLQSCGHRQWLEELQVAQRNLFRTILKPLLGTQPLVSRQLLMSETNA